MSRAALKREIKDQIREFVKEQTEEFLLEQSLAIVGDFFGGCGSLTMAVQAYEAGKLVTLCATLADRFNQPKELIKECMDELMNGVN